MPVHPGRAPFDTDCAVAHRVAMKGTSFFQLLSLTGALALFGCTQPPGAVGQAAGGKAEAGDAAAAAVPEGSPESCANYARRICDQAGGEKSPTCASAKSFTKLISPKVCEVGLAEMAFTITQLESAGKVCKELGERLCKDLGEDTQTCEMVKTQLPQMPAEQCEKMTAEYDKVIKDLEAMEAKNKPLPPEKVAKIAAGENLPSFGNPDATVTIVEFSDFQCPYCSLAANAVNEIKPEYKDKVRVVFRQFPLSFHKQAHLAAQASLAANAQGKFWEYHDKLFANQKQLERANLEAYAEELGLDMDAFKKALDEGTYKETVDAELALGGEVFVSGTPTVFINGKRAANATDAKALAADIDKALAG